MNLEKENELLMLIIKYYADALKQTRPKLKTNTLVALEKSFYAESDIQIASGILDRLDIQDDV